MSLPLRSIGRRQPLHRAVAMLVCLVPFVAAPTPAGAEPADEWAVPLGPPLVVVREFDPPPLRWLAGHRGVDLAAVAGATVRATVSGVVSYAGLVAGRGVVVIRHAGPSSDLRTTYEPVTPAVVVGQQVTAGDTVGVVAAVPRHCAPAVCLHWGLRRGTTYLDPRPVPGAARVRLLPLEPAGPQVSLAALPPSVLRAGMGLFIGSAQPLDRDVRVDLRRRQ